MHTPHQAWSSSHLCVAMNVTPQFLEETLETLILLQPCLIPSQVLVAPCPLLRLHTSSRSTEAPLPPVGIWEPLPKASLHRLLPQHNLLCIKKKKKKKIRTTTGNCKNTNLFRKSTLLIQNSDPKCLLWWFNANCRLNSEMETLLFGWSTEPWVRFFKL